VGETPTGGIHKEQFNNALLRMEIIKDGSANTNSNKKKPEVGTETDDEKSLFILGPTFSGSLYSLKELLTHENAGRFTSVFAHSGTASSWETVDWLDHQQLNGLHFVTFQESDRYSLRHFIHFAKKQGYEPSDIAVLSEEETAYGNLEAAFSPAGQNQVAPGKNCDTELRALWDCDKRNEGSCGPDNEQLQVCEEKEEHKVRDAEAQALKECEKQGRGPCDKSCVAETVAFHGCHGQTKGVCEKTGESLQGCEESKVVQLYFPREISQLRSAYQRDVGAEGSSDGPSRPAPRSTLHLNLEDSGSDEDSVPPYSRLQTPLSQEAVLLGIATSLRAHHTQFVVLRATNPLDQLFLARYLRTAYPEGRVVTSGTDLLFRRETDSSFLHGILAISSYSLIPRADDSTATPEADRERLHADRVFPSSFSVGTYNAMLSLLTCLDYKASSQKGKPCTVSTTRTGSRFFDLPSAHYAEYGWPSIAEDEPARTMAVPPLRLTVLGRDGYWNLALLDSGEYDVSTNDVLSNLHSKTEPAVPHPFEPHLHQPWKLLRGLCLGVVLGYLLLVLCGSIFSASEALAIFAPLPCSRREYLLLAASLLQLAMFLCLMWPWERWTNSDDWANGRERCFWVLLFWLIIVGATWLFKYKGTRSGSITALCLLAVNIVLLWVWSHYPHLATALADRYSRGWWLGPLLILAVLRSLTLRNKASLFFVLSATLIFCGFSFFDRGTKSDASMFLYRYVHITSGVSPLLPWILLLAAGMWWVWYSISGLALLDQRRPRLPESVEDSTFFPLTEGGNRKLLAVLYPASWDPRVYLMPALVILITWLLIDKHHPLQSLEGGLYDRLYTKTLLVGVFVLLCTLLRLAVTWLECHRLLVALDSFPLRRGFKWLDGFSWKPIWRVRGGVLQDSFRILRREVQSLRRFSNELSPDVNDFNRLSTLPEAAEKVQHEIEQRYASAQTSVILSLEELHGQLAETCTQVFGFLRSRWAKEKGIELPASTAAEIGRAQEESKRPVPPPETQMAEQFVCLVYVNFILMVLTRMRTLVMTVAGMFVFLVLSISSYPFEPKQALRSLMVLLLVIIAGFVAVVYAQMHRDATLSRITDTEPGELGLDFWLRLAGFGAVPLISILVAQYPELNSFLFSWLQPALEALK
jgi:hypothetical protein